MTTNLVAQNIPLAHRSVGQKSVLPASAQGIRLKSRYYPGQGLIQRLWGNTCFQVHYYFCCWQNSVPCDCRTEVSPFPCWLSTRGQPWLLERGPTIACHRVPSIFKSAATCQILFMLPISDFPDLWTSFIRSSPSG